MKSYQIRLPRFGLAAKLAAWLVAAALACFALFGYVYQRLEQRNLEALVTLSAERVSDIIYYSAWEAMQRNDRDMLYAMIRDIGREPGIQRLRIVNEEGWVRVSTDPHEVGTMVDKRAEACYACHAQSQPLTRLARKDRARVFVDEATGQRTLAVIRPIENSKECSNAACHAHPADRRILGVIDAHLSLETVDQRLAEMKWQTGWFSLAAAGLAGLLSIAFVWVFVHRPVRELARGTVQLAGGDLAHRIHISSKDELGSLGESFNLMAEELGQMHEELTQWNRTLEDRVRVKTAELETAHKGLIHNEKMASLGRLAATVAHEVNNPLFGMLTYARLTLKDLQRPDLDDATRARMTENLRVIERESRRCGDLMKNLLAFARQSPPQRAPVVVNQLIERAVQLVRHQFDLAQTRLELKLAEGLPEISCDPGQIQQVLIVLLVNAGEALGRGGEVVVRSAALQNGHGVAISVKDNGPGIPPELQTQVFEPFFSTKEDQHRTGLGLAVAKGIVERHGGTLALHSERGQGAEFVIELPLTTPGGPVREEPATSQAAQGASS